MKDKIVTKMVVKKSFLIYKNYIR